MVEEVEPLTVTHFVERLNALLGRAVGTQKFVGEVSEVNRSASGHVYLTIKDEGAQLSCVIWRSTVARLSFFPEVGDAVVASGAPSIYAGSGRFQIVLSGLARAGVGELQKKFLALKAKLEAEGLFDPARKRTLPLLPRRIGIVTSKTGAVIEDIMVRIKARMPHLEVLLVDARVQGAGAAQEIAAGIARLQREDIDVIIVARGGGSIEDLWAFNEEVVVRAVFASKIPVVSGVGHEPDETLCDYAADVRAPTPTAAAEMVVPDCKVLLQQLQELARRLGDTDRWLAPLGQRLDIAADGLHQGMRRLVEVTRTKVLLLAERLGKRSPEAQVARARAAADSALERMRRHIQFFLERRQQRVLASEQRLVALSPLRVLARGYAVVCDVQGRALVSSEQVQVGDALQVRLHSGKVGVQVTETKS